MSNLPPNPFVAGQVNANPGPQLNHSQQFGQVPLSQLPPGYGGLKQDANSNSPLPPSSTSLNSAINQVNNYNQSASSSPAFNHPGMMPPPQTGLQSSPMRPLKAPLPPSSNQSPLPPANVPLSSASRTIPNSNASPIPLTSYQQRQINDNAPPLIPSSHPHLVNGPPMGPPGVTSQPPSQFLPSSNSFGPPLASRPSVSAASFPLPMNPLFGQHQAPAPPGPPTMKAPGTGPVSSQSNVPFSGPPLSGPQRNSPFMAGHVGGLPVSSGQSGPANSGPPVGPPRSMGLNGPSLSGPPVSSVSGVTIGPPKGPGSGLPLGPMGLNSGPPGPSVSGLPVNQYPASQKNGPSGPSMGPPIGSIPFSSGQMGSSTGPMGPPTGPLGTPGLQTGKLGPPGGPMGPPAPSHPPGPMGPPPGPMGSPPGPMGPPSGPMGPPSGPMGPPSGPMGPATGHMGPPTGPMGPSGLHSGLQSLPMGAQSLPPVGHQMGPPLSAHPGPPSGMLSGQKSNMQGRYPQMPSSNYINNQPGMPPQAGVPPQAGLPPTNIGKQYPQQYNAQGMTQQMGQLSVTKQGFDQLWGHQMVDLLACRQILPEYPEDPPEIKLAHQFAESPNCSPDIFRCTINRIPETNSLLQKSRLPLGILIHPFKDLNHLPVIQCTTIVRCRACRTYINPFVYFVDAKRWKCNLCYRVNDLPEEFQYDPVSKSYGDPSRRPEIKSATIEFIAPGEYMLRPPQPAVYLFLMDVSQIARDSGYLQVLCDTLKNSLDQLPGDARTQVGFICFDAHIHYYLMSDGLTRPKEMTVLDIDDVFLPSPESLLVNLGERRELVKELLSVLPQRHSGPGVPSSALGAALQAAYKLMAPTGGRITVFQTCLPNVGPGALQAREDPNARSSADVPHLNPSTDFYKRLALDCSGAQVAVDLFLLNAQYADLATLSGMSKFSGGTLYHIPLFRAARTWQCDQLTRMLTRYLTRKIGFEAVMRVRCTRGIAIHTFHGNFFVRSTDLLSLPNVSPDAGFGMQLTIEESLSDLQQVCFQAALLYTSSKGERRIRVHTMALPIASNLTDVLHSADQQCIVGLLSKMAVDRCASASMQEAREALMNVAVDALSAHRLAQNLPAGGACAGLMAPASLRLLPLYLLALLKREIYADWHRSKDRGLKNYELDKYRQCHLCLNGVRIRKAFRTGTSTRLDDRVADMNDMKTLPLAQLLRAVYPDLYPIHNLRDVTPRPDDDDEPETPDPPRLHLSAERINSSGAYLLDDGEQYTIYVCHAVSGAFLSDTLGVAAFSQVPDEARSLPRLPGEGNALLHAFIDKLNDDRPYASNILILRDNSPNRQLFTERLVDDRVESSFAYYEFLQHIKIQVK